jgi:hypothetical protein
MVFSAKSAGAKLIRRLIEWSTIAKRIFAMHETPSTNMRGVVDAIS